ncbi:tyrosine-type recombinase/integrase [Streptomyces werraensis]|uniref:tyrosine-type recombinase/integrase n=1 Tax=Streptomyces werraensis TaxID=68284 RepID=UPI0034220897
MERKIAGEHWAQAPDQDLIFSSEHDGMIDPVGFSRTFDRLVKRAGVRRITVRLARHTCGSLLAFLKVHPKVAQAILRHSQISMTMNVSRMSSATASGKRSACSPSFWKIHPSADVSRRCQRPPADADWGSLRWWG